MGYDVTVKFKSEEEKNTMKQFLDENQDILRCLSQTDMGMPHSMEVYHGEDLGYAPKVKHLLGFHGTGIPQHMWDLCAWMAVKSSYRARDGEIFFYYDSEKMKVTFDTTNKKNTVVDENGIRIYDMGKSKNPLVRLFNLGPDEKKQHELFVELNDKWFIFQTHQNTRKIKP